jgi:hypothetical protein
MEFLFWILVYATVSGAVATTVRRRHLAGNPHGIMVETDASLVGVLAGIFWPIALPVLLGARISEKLSGGRK